MQRSTPPESRHHPRRPQQVVEVGAADADDAGADLDGAELAVGDELADEAFGDGELVGGPGDGEERRPGRVGGGGRHDAPSYWSGYCGQMPSTGASRTGAGTAGGADSRVWGESSYRCGGRSGGTGAGWSG